MSIALLILAIADEQKIFSVGLACYGAGWASPVAMFNGAAQAAFPLQWRARAVSVHLMAMYSGQALGGILWEAIAEWTGFLTSMIVAATMAAAIPITLRALWRPAN